MIPLFDLHADTLSEMYKKKELLSNNTLHISLEKAKNFAPYLQIMAIWSDFSLSNEDAYDNFKNTLNYAHSLGIKFATNKDELNHGALVLALEDARLTNGKIERLYDLFKFGVKVMTLNWRGQSIVGGGWDVESGLSPFGKRLVSEALELGIIPDISHSSVTGAYDTISIARLKSKPIIASHSNSYSVYNHKRNLPDDLFLEIFSLGGLVGVSLAPEHLANKASISSVIKHIYHYLSLGGEDTVCLGCDFDGVSSLPNGISDLSDLAILYFELEKQLGQKIATKIFYQNAYDFFIKHL